MEREETADSLELNALEDGRSIASSEKANGPALDLGCDRFVLTDLN